MEIIQRISDKEMAMYLAGVVETLPDDKKYQSAKELVIQWRNPPMLVSQQEFNLINSNNKKETKPNAN